MNMRIFSDQADSYVDQILGKTCTYEDSCLKCLFFRLSSARWIQTEEDC